MKAILWVFGVALFLFGLVWLNEDNIRNWFFPNSIEVKAFGDATPEGVKIDWTAESIEDTVTLFDKGKALDYDFRAGGYNTFLLYYKDEFIGSFEQFKSNKVSGHQYNFMIWQGKDSIQADLKILGPEAPL
ncbi:MAG: hypothetical protein ABJH05_08645 [Fulvivirga sp.]